MTVTVAIDLDNVIAETDPKIRKLIESITGISLSQEDIQWWDYAQAVIARGLDPGMSRDVVAQAFDRFHAKDCIDVGPVKGALEAILAIRESGVDVAIVTGRPRTAICEGLTRAWLRNFSIPGSWLIMEDQKVRMCSAWLCLVEDAPHHAMEVARAGTVVYLFDYPWNRHVGSHPLIKRAASWEDIGRCIIQA